MTSKERRCICSLQLGPDSAVCVGAHTDAAFCILQKLRDVGGSVC